MGADTTTTADDEQWVFYCRQCGWSPDPSCPNQARSSDKIGCGMHAGCPDEPTTGSIRWDDTRHVWIPA